MDLKSVSFMISVKLRRSLNERYVTRRTKINHIYHYKNLVEGDYICFQERKIAVVVNDPVLKAITVKGPQVILYEDKDLEIFHNHLAQKKVRTSVDLILKLKILYMCHKKKKNNRTQKQIKKSRRNQLLLIR